MNSPKKSDTECLVVLSLWTNAHESSWRGSCTNNESRIATLPPTLACIGVHRRALACIGVHWETVGLWCKAITEQGLLPFLDVKTTAHRVPHPTSHPANNTAYQAKGVAPARARTQRLRAERLRQSRVYNCVLLGQGLRHPHPLSTCPCPRFTKYSPNAIPYTLRSKRRRNIKRGPRSCPRSARSARSHSVHAGMNEMDTIDFGAVFAFTAVDIFSKEADIYLASALTSDEGRTFLQSYNCV